MEHVIVFPYHNTPLLCLRSEFHEIILILFSPRLFMSSISSAAWLSLVLTLAPSRYLTALQGLATTHRSKQDRDKNKDFANKHLQPQLPLLLAEGLAPSPHNYHPHISTNTLPSPLIAAEVLSQFFYILFSVPIFLSMNQPHLIIASDYNL